MKKRISPIFSFIFGICMIISCANAFIGLSWGRLSSQRLIPSMVVDLLLQNEIDNVRIYTQADNVLSAFADTNIKVTFGITNSVLVKYVDNMTAVEDFVRTKINDYGGTVKIGYLTIGNHPLSKSFNTKEYAKPVDVLEVVQNYLNDHGRSNIKATIPHFTDVFDLRPGMSPSLADFHEGIRAQMVKNVRYLKNNSAPFMLSIFPFDYVSSNKDDVPFDFAFMDNDSNYSVKDNVTGAVYTNVFEYYYDACHYAMEKAGVKDVKIVISATGWPTDSAVGANVTNAERFYRSFLPFIASGRGTPARPNTTIEVFLNNLSDENRLYIEVGAVQRHLGIYKFNGEPKFKIDFSGRGRDIWPSKAQGIISMPSRWCIFNRNKENRAKLDALKEFACQNSDCSSLEPGGSCAHLDEDQQISYAFNRYFQTQSQSSDDTSGVECDMDGYGMLVADDPSDGTCEFPVEILSAENVADGTLFAGGGDRVHGLTSVSAAIWGSIVFGMLQL